MNDIFITQNKWRATGLLLVLALLSFQALGKLAHHDESGFKNPYVETKRGFWKFLKMRYIDGEEFASYEGQADKVPQIAADIDSIHNPDPLKLQYTWIGHSTFLIQYQGINLLTDPIFSERSSPVQFLGPERVIPPAMTIEQLPKIDYVIISHNHYDHLDFDTVQAIGNQPIWIVPLALKFWFKNTKVHPSRVYELGWHTQQSFKNIHFIATPTQHWSGRYLWDRNQTLWSSWVIQIGRANLWFGGDTGYNDKQFKKIGQAYGPFDLAFIPIGAFLPRWFMQTMHVNPEESVKIHQDIRSKHSVGIHWGTFQLSAEAIDQPMLELQQMTQKLLKNNRFDVMAIGETRRL